MKKKNVFLTILTIVGGLLFFWLVLLKLVVKLKQGRGAPCPASLGWLVNNPLRRWDVRHALDRAGLRSGETVLELGPGPGAFTIDAAQRVGPQGRLIAVDIQPGMIAQVDARVRAASVTNVETHVASAYDLPVPDASVDRALLITVLPEIPDPVRALGEIYRVLKPGGVVSMTEQFLDPDYPRCATTIAWAQAAGFELTERYGNWWNYTLNFSRPPTRPIVIPAADLVPPEDLSAVSETMLATLYSHAIESSRSDALICDPRAQELAARIDYDFVRHQMGQEDQAATCVRLRQFDRFAQAFLAAHPDGVVVHIGCGLDTRFDRVDNGRVMWYDLDLPPVIKLRRKLLDETSRYKMIASSALDLAWLDVADVYSGRPFLFIAEGVLMYFSDDEVRRLVLALQERFSGAELVFDVASPLVVWLQNLSLARSKADFRMRWSLRRYDALEAWSPGIRLLETWYYTSLQESIPRLEKTQKLFRLFPPLGKGMVILRYRL